MATAVLETLHEKPDMQNVSDNLELKLHPWCNAGF